MDRTDADKINKALANSILPAGAAAAGLIALCGELGRIGILPTDALHRVKDAMVSDISGTRQADSLQRERLSRQIQAMFDQFAPANPTQPD